MQEQYDVIYEKGYELAKKHYYRFLRYKFEDLVEPKTQPYDPNDYPLPDNDTFDDYIHYLIKEAKNNKQTK